jgi:hypothetical protein
MIIAIDFDGTIVEHKYPAIGELLPHAKEVINYLYNKEHCIIIWTCRYLRKDLMAIIRFLRHNGIKYCAINNNSPCVKLGFYPWPKIYADVYIDDRNLGGFPGWLKVKELLEDK